LTSVDTPKQIGIKQIVVGIIPIHNYINNLCYNCDTMVSVHITAELHAELKAESKRKKVALSQLIGQIRLERERLRELAANIQYLKVDDEFGVISDMTDELIKVKCVARLKLE
jgi:hypothetical protein